MNYRVYCGYEQQVLKVTVTTKKPQSIRLNVSDAEQAFTVFTNRNKVVDGVVTLYVRMPLAPRVAMVTIFDEQQGDQPADKSDFTVKIEKTALLKQLDMVDMKNPDIKGFVDFFQRFCYNCGVMKPGVYESSNGKFTINYQATLHSKSTGQEVTTPARIGEISGTIDISQKHFVGYTVPMRFAIGCHEFSHFYLNKNKRDESEADLNGLLIYLGLGYPRIEAYEAFLQTFIGSPTEMNKKRYDKINAFITNFEKHQFLLYGQQES